MRAGMPLNPDDWGPDQEDLLQARLGAADGFGGDWGPSADDVRTWRLDQELQERTRVLHELTRRRARVRAVALARCPSGDGRILFGVYPFEGQLWFWQEGRRWAPGRFEWPDDPREWEAVTEGLVSAEDAEKLYNAWQDRMDDSDYGFGANAPLPPDEAFTPYPPAVEALGTPDAATAGRTGHSQYPIATCPRCKVDYTPGSMAEVVGIVRAALDQKRPGPLALTRVDSVQDLPIPAGHRLLDMVEQAPHFAWVHTTDEPAPPGAPTPRDQLRMRLAKLKYEEEQTRLHDEHDGP